MLVCSDVQETGVGDGGTDVMVTNRYKIDWCADVSVSVLVCPTRYYCICFIECKTSVNLSLNIIYPEF